jgi:ssDNA-binding Zn-finger/Zn-ribbon topoisomerase 1
MEMIEGECLKCGQRYYGWALLEPRNQSCSKCGVGLLITEDGKTFFKGYSPFEAEKYVIKSPNGVTEPSEEDKGTGIKED